MKKLLAALLVTAALSACVQTSTQMLDERTVVLSSHGGIQYSNADIMRATMVRAAQMTQQRGFQLFTIMGAQDASTTAHIYSPGETHGSGTVTAMGNTATYSGSTYTTPGTLSSFNKPGMDMMIRMYRTGEIDPSQQGVWSAESILAAQPQ